MSRYRRSNLSGMKRLERIERLVHQAETMNASLGFCTYSHFTGELLGPHESGSYGDFDPLNRSGYQKEQERVRAFLKEKTPLYFEASFCGYSDCSGSMVERANHRALREEYGEKPWFHFVYGGHGTEAIFIGVQELLCETDPDTFDSFLSTLEEFEDYPLIDDDLHSQMEMEAQEEAWKGWARADYVYALRKLHPRLEDNPSMDDDKVIDSIYCKVMEQGNIEWTIEQGGGAYIDVNELAERTPEEWLPPCPVCDGEGEIIDPPTLAVPGLAEIFIPCPKCNPDAEKEG